MFLFLVGTRRGLKTPGSPKYVDPLSSRMCVVVDLVLHVVAREDDDLERVGTG